MGEVLDNSAMERWRREPIRFIEEVLHTYDIDTARFAPFKLHDAQRLFLKYAWQTRDDGRLLYPEQIYSTIKKSGKTAFGGAHVITTALIFGGLNADAFCVANDYQQSKDRVFDAIVQTCKNSPYLQRECVITQDRVVFPQTGAVIHAIASSDTSAAGAHPTITSLDEIWGFNNTRLRRLYEEFVPVPTRKISCRLITSHAGYSGESELLEEMYRDGLKLPEIEPGLRGGDNTLFFWSHDRLAPWQTEQWLADMRKQQKRPAQFIRQFENRFVTSENPFIDMVSWDRCVQPSLGHMASSMYPVYVGVDGSTKDDETAVVVCYFDSQTKTVRLVTHRVFTPTPQEPIDFEVVEDYLLDLSRRFRIRKILFDPHQLMSTMQRLAKRGLPVEEYPQTSERLTAASQNLYDLVMSQGIALYPDSAMRTSASRTIAVESSRGWRIAKEKQSAKIDVIVALALAALGAVKSQSESRFLGFGATAHNWVDGVDLGADERGSGGQSYEAHRRGEAGVAFPEWYAEAMRR
jgi:phage terminase large subunit-like protein